MALKNMLIILLLLLDCGNESQLQRETVPNNERTATEVGKGARNNGGAEIARPDIVRPDNAAPD